MKMTVEQRELYLFTTGTEPFKSELERTRANNVGVGKIKSIVTKAWGAYIYDYCTPGDSPFTDEDVEEVFERILSDKVKEMLNNNFTDLTLDTVRVINKEIGQHFFDADTMKFWGTRLASDLFPNCTFVTGDYTAEYLLCGNKKRRFTIRRFNPNTLQIEKAEDDGFLKYATPNQAIKVARTLPSPRI